MTTTKGPLKGLFYFVLSCFILTSCGWRERQIRNQAVVQVNDKELTAKDLAEQLAKRVRKLDALAAKDPANLMRTKEDLVRVFILNAMIETYAKASGIAISEEELDKEVNAIRSNYPDDLSFRRVLAEDGTSLTDWRDQLRVTLTAKKVFAAITKDIQPISTQEIQSLYEKNKDRFKRKEQIYLRQIILDDLAKAEAIKEELRRGDFAELAKKYSVSPEGKSGGLVGWVERGSVDIFDKAFSLPVGGVSKVLESSYGFHIFKVERRAGAGIAQMAEVRDLIEAEIQANKEQAEFSSWLDKQIRISRVLKDQALIDAIIVETRGKVDQKK